MILFGLLVFCYVTSFCYLMYRSLRSPVYAKNRDVCSFYFILYVLGGIGFYINNSPMVVTFAGLALLVDYCCGIHYLIVIQKQEEMKMRQSHWARICAGEQMNPLKAKDS